MRFSTLSALTSIVAVAVAHPGHDLSAEIAERAAFKQNSKRTTLSHCSEKLAARGVEKRNVARRSQGFNRMNKRDINSVLATDHNATETGYSKVTPESTIFSSENSCVLTPEVTVGPYYITGEYVRKNVVEYQAGVPITLDYQVVDVDTCDPVSNVYVEIWHCNATGVYSGIEAPQGGLNATWLRGIQLTDEDGVAQFDSIFPGHYTGRATHIHVLVHSNATIHPNGTIGQDNLASHVGQAFFDDSLIAAVEATSPYTSNQQILTLNADDHILAQEADPDGVDPLMQYALLGDDIADGIFAWLSFGINVTAINEASAAADYYAIGGVANARGSGGPGAGRPHGNSTASGAPPASTGV